MRLTNPLQQTSFDQICQSERQWNNFLFPGNIQHETHGVFLLKSNIPLRT